MRQRRGRLAAFAALAALACCCAGSVAPARALPFPVYEPCSRVPGADTTMGACRREAPPPAGQIRVAAAKLLPIDMRFPCADPDSVCNEVRPPRGRVACRPALRPPFKAFAGAYSLTRPAVHTPAGPRFCHKRVKRQPKRNPTRSYRNRNGNNRTSTSSSRPCPPAARTSPPAT